MLVQRRIAGGGRVCILDRLLLADIVSKAAGLRLQSEGGMTVHDEAAQAILRITKSSLFIYYLSQPLEGPKVDFGLDIALIANLDAKYLKVDQSSFIFQCCLLLSSKQVICRST